MEVIERLRAATEPDRELDEAVARALGFRVAASTRGPHIMREGSVASWDLPAYTATAESRADAVRRFRCHVKNQRSDTPDSAASHAACAKEASGTNAGNAAHDVTAGASGGVARAAFTGREIAMIRALEMIATGMAPNEGPRTNWAVCQGIAKEALANIGWPADQPSTT